MDHPKFAKVAVRVGGSIVHWLVAGAIATVVAVIVAVAYGYAHTDTVVAVMPGACP